MHPVIANMLEIALILLLGFLARFVIVKIVKHLVRQARKPPADRGRFRRGAANLATVWAGEREAQRSAALGSLVISLSSVVIGLICVLGILSVLGIDLTPVLASAGVLGVIIGFGAQNLIKDLISGIGMLLEDQIGVGDVSTWRRRAARSRPSAYGSRGSATRPGSSGTSATARCSASATRARAWPRS